MLKIDGNSVIGKKHKKFIHLAILAPIALGTPAVAGNPFTPPIDDVIVIDSPTSQEWGGLYAGGSLSFENGTWDAFNVTTIPTSWTTEGSKIGGFVGINYQHNALVWGGELAYSGGDATYTRNSDGAEADYSEIFWDAKARVGYSFNKVLAYGVAGVTVGSSESVVSGSVTDLEGVVFGAGVQVKVSDSLFVGVEYLNRDLTGSIEAFPAFHSDYTNQSIALRAGIQF